MRSMMEGTNSALNGFREDIEGMRGVAVLLVVLFHCGIPGFSGGFIGVDVFFALSGYLITALIVNELGSSGNFSFRNFYARRVRRLLPASGLVVVTTLLLGSFVYSPLELANYVKWARYTSLYVSNYMFMRDAANYFARDVALNPYLHTWSLAVEEQFYLFWPALIVASLALMKSRRGLAIILIIVSAMSFGLCVWLTQVRQPWAFFSLPTRAWEFALGGLACQLSKPQLGARAGLMKILGWSGLASVVASGCLYSAEMSFPGYAAILPIAGTLAVLVAGASGVQSPLQLLLGSEVLQYLGRLSYSWYLWHWPVLLMMKACFPNLTWPGRLLAVTIALGLSQITYWLLEKPTRISPFLIARPMVSLSLALVVAILGISVASLISKRMNVLLNSGEQARLWMASHDTRTLFDAHCVVPAGVSHIKECEYGQRQSSTTVVLFGDSHAEHWFPALDAIAEEKHWQLLTLLKASCPAARIRVYNVVLKREDTECSIWREAAIATILKQSPFLVVLSEKDAIVENRSSPMRARGSHQIPAKEWEEGLRSTVSSLSEHGSRTLLIADVPRARLDIPTCLSRALAHSWAAHDCVIHRDAALNSDSLQAERAAVKGIRDVKLADFSDTFCLGAVCQPMMSGQVIYRDSNHMTSSFARGFAPPLLQQIDSLIQTQSRNRVAVLPSDRPDITETQ